METSDIEKLIELVSFGKTSTVLKQLRANRNEFKGQKKKIELDLIYSRYSALNLDIGRNFINNVDGQRELSKINYSLLTFLNSELNGNETTQEDIYLEVKNLAKKYNASKKIKSNSYRLREKNQIVRRICYLFIEEPELINKYIRTKNNGILAGIAYKIMIVPRIDDLKILDSISKRSTSNFTKGSIVNAIAELIYSGEMRIGDPKIIGIILERLRVDADIPLQKNIKRVEVALEYLFEN